MKAYEINGRRFSKSANLQAVEKYTSKHVQVKKGIRIAKNTPLIVLFYSEPNKTITNSEWLWFIHHKIRKGTVHKTLRTAPLQSISLDSNPKSICVPPAKIGLKVVGE